jgi:hypothetical protein
MPDVIKKDNKDKVAASVGASDVAEISNKANSVNRYKEMGINLSELNTGRGGENFKGFVFEELHAADATVNGYSTVVINNNGPADLKITSPKGRVTNAQAKTGYKTRKAGFADNECKTVVVDNGNAKLVKEAKQSGKKVIESNITDAEAKQLAKAMKAEAKITGSNNSVIVSKTASAAKAAKEIHKAGVSSASKGAVSGGAFSLGSNIVEVATGDKKLGEAAGDVVVDTAVSAAVGYGVGTTATALASTTAGAAVASTVSATAATVTTAIGSTTAGAAALGAAATVGSTAAAGAAAISTGTAAVLGTTIAGTAAGAAIVAAAPVVVVGVAIGAVATGISKLFKRR